MKRKKAKPARLSLVGGSVTKSSTPNPSKAHDADMISPIPGFGKFPQTAKPQALKPRPLPYQFLSAMEGPTWELPTNNDRDTLKKPFTPKWKGVWDKICLAWDNGECRKKYQHFISNGGMDSLRSLAEKGADPNFILSLFAQYMWLEDDIVPLFDHKDPNVTAHFQDLAAIRNTKQLFRNHTWEPSPESRLVQKALSYLEEIILSYINERDFRIGETRGSARDKINRVIFTLHEHLRQKAQGPRWEVFWNLLVAARAIKGGGTQVHKDGQIKAHIRSFLKDHPKEVHFIRSRNVS